MLTSSRPHSLGGILLCSIALASCVTSSALPADAHNRPRDTSCTAKYGYIQIINTTNPTATWYIDNAGNPADDYQFKPTSDLTNAGIFKYQNCEGFGLADLETINYATPNTDYRLLGLRGPVDTTLSDREWFPVGVNHIGGPGPFFFPSQEPIPGQDGIVGSAESALWSFAPDGTTLITQITHPSYSFSTAHPVWGLWDIPGLIFELNSWPAVNQPTLTFVPVEIGLNGICYTDGWYDQAPCQIGPCQQSTSSVNDSLNGVWRCLA